MKLKEKFPQMKRDEETVRQREELIIKKIRNAEVSVPGEYSVDSVGKWATRAFIYPENPKDVKTLARELGKVFDAVWKLDFRNTERKFMYIARKPDYWGKGESFLVMVENVPTPPNCKIIKKQVKVARYEKRCAQEEVNV